MASNGVILLNLNNRNAADFQRLEVPDSYEKASGALTAGTYVTVYKWLYQGFMMAPSLCDAVDANDHINLVDRTNGGILEVYPDDTVEILSDIAPGPEPEPEPEPEPLILVPLTVSDPGVYDPSDYDADGFNEVTVLSPPLRATRVWTHSTGGNDASVYMQSGTYENEVFVPSGEATDVIYTGASDWVGQGIVQVKYANSWIVRGIFPVLFDGTSYPASQVITSWSYNTSVDYLFVEIPAGPASYPIEILKVTLQEPQTVGDTDSRISWQVYIADDDGSEEDTQWTSINIDPTVDSSVITISGWGSLQWKYTSTFASRQLFFTPAYNMGLLSNVYDETGAAYKAVGIVEAGKSYAIMEITSTGTQKSKIGIFYKL